MSPQTPGTIKNNVYLSQDGAFTVQFDERLWHVNTGESGKESGLYLKNAQNVWISFAKTEGITSSMITSFEETFVSGYMEGIREYYPDAKEADSRIVNAGLARLDMTMYSDTGENDMYQILYLATDGENGYIITSTLHKDEVERVRPLIAQVVESIEFTGREKFAEPEQP